MKHTFYFVICILAFIVVSFTVEAQIHQWRGENSAGVFNEDGLLKSWENKKPVLLWHTDSLGKSYASMSIAKNRIYSTSSFDSTDYIIALSIDGDFLWKTPIGRRWSRTYNDSRATPTYSDGKLYAMSGLGDLACIDATSGEQIWQVEVFDKFEGNPARFGVSESPLVIDNKVICTPAGEQTTMVALNKNTGKLIWKTDTIDNLSAYVSPLHVKYKDIDLIVSVAANYVFGVDANNGNVLWRYNYTANHTSSKRPRNNTNTPLYSDGDLFITSGYNHSGIMLSLADDAKSVKLKWENNDLDVHHGGVVKVGNFIYGSNWLHNRMGNWACINWDTGETLYDTEWKNKGVIIAANDRLYCYEEKSGFMTIAEANGKNFVPLGEIKIEYGDGQQWSHPVIYNGILYVRHGGSIMAYNIKDK